MNNNSDNRSESDYRKTEYAPYHRKKIGSFLLFLFSALPGANYMYMGFMKKGSVAMSSFFMTIYLTSIFNFFAFILPILWFFSFFDGFRIRRSLNDGIYVDDNVDDIIRFVKKYTFHILAFLVAMFVFSFLSTSLNYAFDFFGISNYHGKRFLDMLPPIIVIVVGYLIIKESSPKSDNVIDKRNDNFK